jgi:vacuolar-type H+-ATPase subunit I/STV1
MALQPTWIAICLVGWALIGCGRPAEGQGREDASQRDELARSLERALEEGDRALADLRETLAREQGQIRADLQRLDAELAARRELARVKLESLRGRTQETLQGWKEDAEAAAEALQQALSDARNRLHSNSPEGEPR